MDELKHNIFRFATSELSHSALWAWVLQSLDSSDQALEGPKRLANRLIEFLGIPQISTSVTVDTEFKLPHGGRLDIKLTDESGVVLVIENKVKAIPTRRQLDGYRGSLKESDSLYLVLMSTAFDEHMRVELPWRYVGVDDLLDLVRSANTGHLFLNDYQAWLEKLQKHRSAIKQGVFSDNSGVRSNALRDVLGQWLFMKRATRMIEGRQYRGMNRGGTPWTEFAFVKDEEARDALYYRIDSRKQGPYLSLCQYQKQPNPSWQAKRERLNLLRQSWRDACADHGLGEHLRKSSSHGVKQSEVGWFSLAEMDLDTLFSRLPVVHSGFLDKIKILGMA